MVKIEVSDDLLEALKAMGDAQIVQYYNISHINLWRLKEYGKRLAAEGVGVSDYKKFKDIKVKKFNWEDNV